MYKATGIYESFDWIYSSCSYDFFVEKGTDLMYKQSNSLRKPSKAFVCTLEKGVHGRKEP